MPDTLQIFGKTFSNATGIVATDNTDTERTFIRPTGTKTIDKNGTYDVSEYASAEVSVSSGGDEPIPEDGKTRIFIHIAKGTPDNCLRFYLWFQTSKDNNTTVDWGDGTVETLGKTTGANCKHRYSKSGDYIITMTVNTGTISFIGTSSLYSIYGARTNSLYYLRPRIKRIIFGNDVKDIDSYACAYCYSLSSVKLPDSVTSIGNNAFCHCYSIILVTIPDGVTSIGQSAFGNCYGITVMTVPNSVTSIGANAFSNCHSMFEYHFKSTTPPTLENKNAFNSIDPDCIIYVPQGSLSAYQQATNWSNYASYMQEEPT